MAKSEALMAQDAASRRITRGKERNEKRRGGAEEEIAKSVQQRGSRSYTG